MERKASRLGLTSLLFIALTLIVGLSAPTCAKATTSDGPALEVCATQGVWKKNSSGWWYEYSDGSYPRSRLVKIDSSLYYFNSRGYMITGWLKIGTKWYYFKSSGAAARGWLAVGGKWYWFDSSSVMATGWKELGGRWYYLSPSGAMVTGWQKIGGKWYYFASSGAMSASKWVGDYYVGPDGVMLANTTTPDGYHVGPSGLYEVYWTPGGSVYHRTRDCPSLWRSSDIRSGTIVQSGKSRWCHDCFH